MDQGTATIIHRDLAATQEPIEVDISKAVVIVTMVENSLRWKSQSGDQSIHE